MFIWIYIYFIYQKGIVMIIILEWKDSKQEEDLLLKQKLSFRSFQTK